MENAKFWKMAAKPTGRPRIFKSPDELWGKAVEYFEWIDSNPWQQKSAQSGSSERGGDDMKNSSMTQFVKLLPRPYTLYGLCAYMGVGKWADFKRTYYTEDQPEYRDVIDHIENIIVAQQMDGAMLRQFDGGLVARVNRIADVVEETVSVSDVRLPKLTDADFEKIKALNGGK